MPDIPEFDWDTRNVRHIGQHHIAPEEVEELRSSRLFIVRVGRVRFRATGVTDSGRYLTVFMDREFDEVYYVVTARDASRRERQQYQRR